MDRRPWLDVVCLRTSTDTRWARGQVSPSRDDRKGRTMHTRSDLGSGPCSVLAQPCPHLDDVLQLWMFACVFFFVPSFFLIFQDVLIFASTAWWKNRDRAESVHRSQFFSCQGFLRSTQYYIRAQASRSMCSLTDSLCCYLLRDHRSSRATCEEDY